MFYKSQVDNSNFTIKKWAFEKHLKYDIAPFRQMLFLRLLVDESISKTKFIIFLCTQVLHAPM